jgi:hypothetical protein
VSEPSKGQRRFRSGFIAVWLAVQLALPAWYYVGDRDPHDERFAWRMFSPTRMVTCNIEFYEGNARTPNPERVQRELHVAWRAYLQRGRLTIARRYMEKTCQSLREQGVAEPWVSMRMTCRNPGGQGAEVRLRREDNACTPSDEAAEASNARRATTGGGP